MLLTFTASMEQDRRIASASDFRRHNDRGLQAGNEYDACGSDSNMRLLGPNSKITARNAINASFHAVDVRGDGGRRWVFQDVAPGGVAQRCGVLPDDVLLTIDGAPAAPP
jgi:hypothetical protein